MKSITWNPQFVTVWDRHHIPMHQIAVGARDPFEVFKAVQAIVRAPRSLTLLKGGAM